MEKGLRKEHGTPKGRSDAGAEPSGARTEQRTPKGARDSERTLRCRSIAQRSPNGAEDSERSTRLRKDAPMQERSPSGARAEPERRKDAERSTGHRKDVRARETTLLRDPRISRHRWGPRWAFKPSRPLWLPSIWRPVRSRGTRPAVISRAADPLASCESQTHVYNDTPLDGGTQQTGQETKRTDARAGALCILARTCPSS